MTLRKRREKLAVYEIDRGSFERVRGVGDTVSNLCANLSGLFGFEALNLTLFLAIFSVETRVQGNFFELLFV